MYWRQVAVSAGLGAIVGGWISFQGYGTLEIVAAGLAAYIIFRILISTFFRVRHWYRRGEPSGAGRSCPDCGQYVRRQGGDWVPECKRCSWTAGLPGIRWLTHSVPVVQLRRSVESGRALALLACVALIGLSATGGVSGLGNVDLGSSPSYSDGDGIKDELETANETADGYPLPGADPQHKDLYLRVYISDGIEPLSQTEQADLKRIWAQMPVSNPGGDSGIDVHITQVEISESVTANLSSETLREEGRNIYRDRVPEAAHCSVYAVLLVEPAGDPEIAGRGDSPGFMSIVDGTQTERYETEYTVRTTTITHELLHNVVGEFEDGSIHTNGGWLNGDPEQHGTEFYLSNKTATTLSERGFAESEYYREEVCR